MNIIEAKLKVYIENYQYNSRKSSVLAIIEEGFNNLKLTRILKVTRNRVKKLASNGGISSKYTRPGVLIETLLKDIELTEQEAEGFIDWDDGKFIPYNSQDLSADIIYHKTDSLKSPIIKEDNYFIDPFLLKRLLRLI